MIFRNKPYILFSLLTIFVRAIAAIPITYFDDAFITFRYARNLSEGFGFVYNHGENVLGVTGPLWGLIISPLFLITDNAQVLVLAFNILLEAAIVFVTTKYIFGKENSIASYIFLLFYLISPITARINIGGMEMNLFILLSLVTLIIYSKEYNKLSIALSAILIFIRPEGVVLLFVLFTDIMFRKKYSLLLKSLLIAILIIIVPLFIQYFYYGSLLPQSIIAKSGLAPQPLIVVINEFLFSDIICIISIPFFVIGIVQKKTKFYKLILIWVSLFFLTYMIRRPLIWTWYPALVHYAMFVFASLGINSLIVRFDLNRFFESKLFRIIVPSLIISIWIIISVKFGSSPVDKHIFKPMVEYGKLQQFKNKTIMASDIGIVGFAFSDSYIIDTEALVSPQVSFSDSYEEKIMKFKPDYISVIAIKENIELFQNDTLLSTIYSPINRFSITGQKELYPDTDNLPNGWVQDYIIFKKIQ